MRPTEVLLGLRRMKFEDAHEGWQQRCLTLGRDHRNLQAARSQAEAAEILGMSEQTFRRRRWPIALRMHPGIAARLAPLARISHRG